MTLGWRRLIGIVALIGAALVVWGKLTGAQWVQTIALMVGMK